MARVESQMGYISGFASANGSIDIMQVLDARNPAIQRLAAEGKFDPNEGKMPKDGYLLFKQLYPSGNYNNSNATPTMSFAAGIRWFIHKSSDPAKYNGGGDPDYVKKVTGYLGQMK